MDKIQPLTVRNYLLRKGKCEEFEVISELGIYGIFIG